MANLYSQYASGLQFTAGVFAGSSLGVSGLNPIVDRLNSISNNNCAITGSMVSGTSTKMYGTFVSGTDVYGTTVSGGNYRGTNYYAVTLVSGPTIMGNNISGTSIRGTLTGSLYGNVSGTSAVIFAGSINQTSGMIIIENRTSDPAGAATGRLWIRTDL